MANKLLAHARECLYCSKLADVEVVRQYTDGYGPTMYLCAEHGAQYQAETRERFNGLVTLHVYPLTPDGAALVWPADKPELGPAYR